MIRDGGLRPGEVPQPDDGRRGPAFRLEALVRGPHNICG